MPNLCRLHSVEKYNTPSDAVCSLTLSHARDILNLHLFHLIHYNLLLVKEGKPTIRSGSLFGSVDMESAGWVEIRS